MFRSLLQIHNQASHWNSFTFNWRPWHAKLQTSCKSFTEWLLFVLFEFFENLLEMATRRNDSVIKGSKSNQSSFAWTVYPVAVKRDLWLWMSRVKHTYWLSVNTFFIEALKSFCANLPVFIDFFDFSFRAVTDTESRSNVSSDVRSCERVASCCLNGCFYSVLVFWKSAWKSYSKKLFIC